MSFLDKLKDGVTKVLPDKKSGTRMSTSVSGGIGNGHGAMGFQDDMIVSKTAIILHTSQIFFNFLAMCCFASVASFQAHWKVGPSGLTGFALFVSIAGIFLSAFMMFVPVVYEKYDKFNRLARALKEVRVTFILVGAGTVFSLLIAFITIISAFTEPGCKDASKDPNQDKGDDFKKGLGGWCSTKKAGSIFFWLAFGFWAGSLVVAVLDWRSGKFAGPRDQPFTHPEDDLDNELDDEESRYEATIPSRRTTVEDATAVQSPFSDNNRYSGASSTAVPTTAGYTSPTRYSSPTAAQPRPSLDVYGAFSDPPPTGFGAPSAPSTEDAGPHVSRTMQYADPYAAVRASVAASSGPPSYSYQGYQ